VLSHKPEKLVYISCNPETLARDLTYLKNEYKVRKIQPVDMFPGTNHIETVVLLSRKDVYERIKFDVNVEELMG
jgi:23S rRNA (uracil1939-C5)-methyltransferase